MWLLRVEKLSGGVPCLCLFVVSALLLSGCSGGVDQPDTVAVDGAVLYKGKPVEGATVVFFTDSAPKTSSGVTDAEGKFKLTMYEPGDGAVVGSHKVTVTKVKTGPKASEAEMEKMLSDPGALAGASAQGSAETKAPDALIPEKYADREKSGLTADVKAEGRNTFTFELTD